MDTSPSLPGGNGVALVSLIVPVTNTSATVTVSFDGGTALAVKTASGNDPAIGGLVAGMALLGVVVGSEFRMRSDQAAAAVQTAVENAQAAAEAAQNGAETARDEAEAAAALAAQRFVRVRVVTTSNVDIAGGGLAAGTTHDGVTLVAADLALLTGQTDPAENGVYVVPASGAASRSTQFDAYDDHPGTYFSVMEGTANADTLWRCTSDKGGALDTDPLELEQAQVPTGDYDTTTDAAAASIPASLPAVHIDRFVSGSEFAPDVYVRAASEPDSPRKFQDALGQWWEGLADRDFVSLHKFDLRGDGATDELTKLQAALDSGEALFVPSGTFLVDGQAALSSDTIIVGMDRKRSLFKLADDARNNIFRAEGESDIHLSRIGFDGNSGNQTGERTGACISFIDLEDFSVIDTYSKDSFNDSYLFRSCSDGHIERAFIDGSGNHGLSFSGVAGTSYCEDLIIINNRVRDMRRSAINHAFTRKCHTIANRAYHRTGHTDPEAGAAFRWTNESQWNTGVGNGARGVARGILVGSNGVVRNTFLAHTFVDLQMQGILCTSPDNVFDGGTIDNPGLGGSDGEGIEIADGTEPASTPGNVTVVNWRIRGNPTYMANGVTDATSSGGRNTYDNLDISGYSNRPLNTVHDDVSVGKITSALGGTIASASTIDLPPGRDTFGVTGTTNITAITGGWEGREVKLRFSDVLTVTSGSGLGISPRPFGRC